MVDVPAVTPVTIPLVEPTVALAFELLQVPPLVASARVVVRPAQTLVVPVIAAGNGLTSILVVDIQPVLSMYVIVDVPAVTPVTIPDVEPIIALAFELLQVPPLVASARVVVRPAQTLVVPVIAAGNGLTSILVVEIQPVLSM